MTLQAGEIVLLPFPFTDLSSAKRRPALVLKASDARGDFVALAITSQPQSENAAALSQDDLEQGQLPKPSWIRTDKPYSFHQTLVAAVFGRLKPEKFLQVQAQLCLHLGCR
jgi:mRNA interferase MazF